LVLRGAEGKIPLAHSTIIIKTFANPRTKCLF
jgi:hypothetical protein